MKKNKNSVVVAEPVVVEPLPVFEECKSSDAAERVRFHLDEAKKHGRCAIAHIIEAGRELALQKQLLGYGQWATWCDNNLEITQRTADKYIETFQKTVGAARLEQGVALDKKILKVDPFQVLDQKGVGKLIKYAVKNGREIRPDLRCGICGEHGGEPSSVKFCAKIGMNYASCSPFRVPIARLAAAQAAIEE